MHRRRQRGAVSAQLVIAMPVLMLLITASVQFAVYEHAVNVAVDAAQRGLQGARIQGGSDTAGQMAALSDAAQLGGGILVSPTVTVTRIGNSIRVQVQGNAEAVMPGITLQVVGVAAGPVEQFSSASGP
ncbi:MAG: pilus assembly protein TadE [Candidatus Aeolococcus gillhamiae]|uniref:Pilus assembly protein TadE n=1 Tax=Candidatus Aeolococcus gillhamiae TaxID=3127015 RepID=A0A2W6AQV9_9BACT|nr:MAG: pilus assembly protein TadE [Candidatus Dormibacter sp. RRmetagenome_bin12]